MQLLGASTAPAPEFASISLLLKHEKDEPVTLGEPLLLASPVATISMSSATDALTELHNHLFHVIKAASSIDKGNSNSDSVAIELLTNDFNRLSGMQIFRPIAASGMGLYYLFEKDNKDMLSSVSSLGLVSHQNDDSDTRIDPSKIHGVVFCVGVSGLHWAHGSAAIPYSLGQRMKDCLSVLERIGDKDVASAKTALASFFLTENEYRKSNAMIEARQTIVIPDTASATNGTIKKSRRSAGKSGLSGREGTTESILPMELQPNSADASRTLIDRLTLLSVAESETFLNKYKNSGQERRANLDLIGGSKSRFRRRKGDTKDADFDAFDFKGPKRENALRKQLSSSKIQQTSSEFSDGTPPPMPGALQLRSSKKDTKFKGKNVPVLSAPQSDASNPRNSRRLGRPQFDDEVSESTRSQPLGSAGAANRIQVNIALNEDLSCSYKQSQLSTASVEGVIQLQLKTNARSVVPFHLFLRDSSSHISTLQENRTFAEDVTGELARDSESDYADRKFLLRVQNGDSYIPVLRYKCTSDLRPVPIRVQTRVKVEGRMCRVALQISSNPNNSASLADLTIMMNAPDVLLGETLVTQPEGGVWDEAKHSVIWCVSELGSGEKFQLQARLQMIDSSITAEDLSFPVMVRCQCLFAQLSDIELEVRDIPEIAPAEMTMKVARRFRLSHREKS